MQYRNGQPSAVQYSKEQHSVAQCSAVQSNTLKTQCIPGQWSEAQYGALQYCETVISGQYRTIKEYSPLQHRTMRTYIVAQYFQTREEYCSLFPCRCARDTLATFPPADTTSNLTSEVRELGRRTACLRMHSEPFICTAATCTLAYAGSQGRPGERCCLCARLGMHLAYKCSTVYMADHCTVLYTWQTIVVKCFMTRLHVVGASFSVQRVPLLPSPLTSAGKRYNTTGSKCTALCAKDAAASARAGILPALLVALAYIII